MDFFEISIKGLKKYLNTEFKFDEVYFFILNYFRLGKFGWHT